MATMRVFPELKVQPGSLVLLSSRTKAGIFHSEVALTVPIKDGVRCRTGSSCSAWIWLSESPWDAASGGLYTIAEQRDAAWMSLLKAWELDAKKKNRQGVSDKVISFRDAS